MSNFEFLSEENKVKLNGKASRPKKLTGTRFASVLGLNRWNSPFQTWCEITKAYQKPFEDTIYTLAGKAIEPKQIDYVRTKLGYSDLKSPEDVYGKDYFSKTYGDFFPSSKIFGGMWDAVLLNEDNSIDTVFEFKTTKRSEDWLDGVPDYYHLQAALYGMLGNARKVYVVVSFLDEGDYDNPEAFVPTCENTQVYDIGFEDNIYHYNDLMEQAHCWYQEHVLVDCPVSPEYDEKIDAEYLKEMRKATISPDSNVEALLKEAAGLMVDIETVENTIVDKQKRLKLIKDSLKKTTMQNIGDKKTAELKGSGLVAKLTLSNRSGIDEKALKDDGLYERYATKKEVATFKLSFE